MSLCFRCQNYRIDHPSGLHNDRDYVTRLQLLLREIVNHYEDFPLHPCTSRHSSNCDAIYFWYCTDVLRMNSPLHPDLSSKKVDEQLHNKCRHIFYLSIGPYLLILANVFQGHQYHGSLVQHHLQEYYLLPK
jgi:hypothetical protein